MKFFADTRKAAIVLAIVVAFVTVVVPTCRMIGCSMDKGYMGFMHGGSEVGFFGTCGGTYTFSDTPEALMPASFNALLLALMAAVMAAVALFSPRMVARPVRLIDRTPPPPPAEPRGERFRV